MQKSHLPYSSPLLEHFSFASYGSSASEPQKGNMLSNVRLDKLYLHHLKSNTFFATRTQRPNEIKTAACAFVRVFVFWWQTSCRRWAVWIERQWDLKEMRTHSNNVLDDSITFSYRNVSFVFLWIALLRKCHANRLFVHFKTPFTLSSRSPLAASSLAMAAVKLRIPVCIRSMVMGGGDVVAAAYVTGRFNLSVCVRALCTLQSASSWREWQYLSTA